jgi:hypothetical protein
MINIEQKIKFSTVFVNSHFTINIKKLKKWQVHQKDPLGHESKKQKN